MTMENLTRDGFRAASRTFTVPTDTTHLERKLKRELTICNLFLNHQLSINDIVRVLDERHENVVCSLIAHGVVVDRRCNPGKPLEAERRGSLKVEAVTKTKPNLALG